MTILDLYTNALVEMNKVQAPSLLIEDYNYFINKAVQQYINKVYNRYDVNQQSSDDLRVLKATCELDLTRLNERYRTVFHTYLPDDYMHILNCIVYFKAKKNYKCYHEGDVIAVPAKRMTSDLTSGIFNNAYLKPSFKHPYFVINNVDKVYEKTLNPEVYYPVEDTQIEAASGTTRTNGERYGNFSKVRMEIHCGNDFSIFEPERIYIDYIKSPMFIELTYAQSIATDDTTNELEFPDYVCYEIINEFIKLLMENSSDPRLQTNIPINQTIANPLASQ